MLFLVEDALFGTPGEGLLLATLFGLSILHKHRLLVVPQARPNFDAWLQGRLPREQDAIGALFDRTFDRETAEPARRRVRVRAQGADWRSSPPIASLAEAVELASRPFGVMLEGLTADRAFLFACATSDQRRRLENMETQGLLEFINGGGLENMAPEVDKVRLPTHLLRWVLFDSDALVPGEPSVPSCEAKASCERRDVRHHRLTRRTIENYLPEAALQRWVVLQRRKDWKHHRERARRVKAWRTLSPEQRAHYAMKKGFDGDKERCKRMSVPEQATYSSFWSLPPDIHAELSKGFGKDIAQLFVEGASAGITGDVMQADGAIRDMMKDLMEWLR